MTQIPNITTGLNKFTPELFQRMGDAIAVAEDSNFGDQLDGFKVWPSFWARITGFRVETDPPQQTIRQFSYLWTGGGFKSGEPDDENFAPAVNLAESSIEEGTFLGIDVERLEETGNFKVMPYVSHTGKIQNNAGELDKGIGEYFKTTGGNTVRMYLIGLQREIEDPNTGEPYPDSSQAPTVGVYAFSATPMIDGKCPP